MLVPRPPGLSLSKILSHESFLDHFVPDAFFGVTDDFHYFIRGILCFSSMCSSGFFIVTLNFFKPRGTSSRIGTRLVWWVLRAIATQVSMLFTSETLAGSHQFLFFVHGNGLPCTNAIWSGIHRIWIAVLVVTRLETWFPIRSPWFR
jgi:hypothetical protein